MTAAQREELATLIREKLPPVPVVEEMIAHDIKTIEPFIDDLVRQGEMRGKLEAWFSIGEAIQRTCKRCGHARDLHWHNRGTIPPFERVADTICHKITDTDLGHVCSCNQFTLPQWPKPFANLPLSTPF